MSRNWKHAIPVARSIRTAVPNALSLLRLILGCGFPLVPADARLLVIGVAALTDLADGALSRGLHADSRFGRMLDPVADKVFVLGVVLTLIAEGILPPERAVLIGLRDLTVIAGTGWLLLRHGRSAVPSLAPTWLGKATTAAQFFFLIGVLVAGQSVVTALFLLTATLSALASLDYLGRFFRLEAEYRLPARASERLP